MSWALKKLQVKKPGIDEEEDMLSRHHAEVATELDQYSEERKSLHHTEVATEDEQLKDLYVATSGSCRDINTESEAVATSACKELKVATSSPEERRSRHQSDVATSVIKEEGRDNT